MQGGVANAVVGGKPDQHHLQKVEFIQHSVGKIYMYLKEKWKLSVFFLQKICQKEHSLEDLSGSSNLVSQSCAACAFFASVVVERGVGVDLREILLSWKIWSHEVDEGDGNKPQGWFPFSAHWQVQAGWCGTLLLVEGTI